MADFGVQLDTKELDRIARELGVKTERVGMRFAFQVEGLYKMGAAVDTGAMSNSCYVEGRSENDFSEKASDASNLNPNAITVRHPQPKGHIIANVGPCVDYAIYVEFGTARQSAQPALGPAVQSLEKKYNSGKEWKEIVK